MRKLLIIIISLFVVGCSENETFNPRLLSIEKTIAKNPTNCLQKLENSKAIVKTKADSMLYALLYTESARAMGMSFVNENWIRPSVDYFSGIGDKDRTERSMFMLALCYYDDGRYDKAAEWLLKTSNINSRNNPSLRCRLYLTLGDINSIAGQQQEMIDDYRKAYDEALRSEDKERQTSALYQLAISYYHIAQTDSLGEITNKLKSISNSSDIDKSKAQTAEGMLYLLNKDTTSAYKVLSKAQTNSSDYRATSLMAEILDNKGKKEAALNLWMIASNSLDRGIAISALSHLVDNVKPMAYKLELSQYLNKLYADKPTAEETAKIIEVQNKFDEKAKEEQSHQKIVFLSIAASTLLVIIVLISLLVFRRTRQRKKNEESWDIERELLSSEVVTRLHELASKGNKAEPKDLLDLDELIARHDKRLSVLLNKEKNLSAIDCHVVQLIRLRFQPSEIAVLLELSPQRVTNSRSRLLLRFFGVKGGAKDFDKRIRDL